MKTYLTLLFCLAAGPLCAQLAYDVPQGWTQTRNPNTGLISLSPPGLRSGRVVVLTVVNPEAFSGSATEFHTEVVRRAATNARQLEPPLHGTVGAFLVTALHQLMPAGIALWLRIYTARWADRGQTFILTANTPEAAPFVPVVDAMMSRIAVSQPVAAAPQAAPAAPPPPRPTVSATGQIDGVYVTLKNKGGYNFGVSKDYMVFFPNGEVLWHLPEEGLLNYDLGSSHQGWRDFWGHYEMQGERFHVTFNTGPDYNGNRNRDGTLKIGSYTYVHQTSGADGRTLSGTYRAYNLGADPKWDVTFYPDGRFDDKGIRGAVGGLDLAYGRAKVPADPGRGRYRIAQYSIVFEYTDGRREQLSFYVPDDDGSSAPKQLVINTFNVVRVSQ